MKWYQRNVVLTVLFAALPLWFACAGDDSAPSDQAKTGDATEEVEAVPTFPEHIPHYELKLQLRKYAKVDIAFDEEVLSEPEKEALGKLVRAGRIMDEIFFEQVWPGNAEIRDKLNDLHRYSHDHKYGEIGEKHDLIWNLIRFYNINFGPWDRLDEDAPFIKDFAKPKGAAYYPEDMTKEEFDNFIAQNEDQADLFRDYFTVIRRKDGALTAVPYNKEYKGYLEPAATLLHEAADILTKPENKSKFADGVDYTSLAKYLRSRADAFSSNTYRESDMDWMDVKDNIIDVTIGPYEVYEDALFGYKAAFEAFIAIRHPADSKKLAGIKQYMQKLENSLPIPDEHKNPNRGSESPVSVVDLVFSGGDTKAGVQTIAFNLPNDEVVREAKGSKKVMLKNISRAKFDKILTPIADQVLDPDQKKHVVFDAYFNNTLMHEISHGLGPGTIIKDGVETTVNRELKELYSAIEEAKADILGLYCTRVLLKEGFLEKGSDTRGYVCFLPGFFRSIRFGATSAHGKANMMEFNYLREKGAITLNPETDKFHVDLDKMPGAVEAMSKELLMIEALGDYEGAKAFIDKYGEMGEDLERLLGKLDKIPVDIEPLFAAESYLEESQRRFSHVQYRMPIHDHSDHDHEH
jgi:hypothetical protein